MKKLEKRIRLNEENYETIKENNSKFKINLLNKFN